MSIRAARSAQRASVGGRDAQVDHRRGCVRCSRLWPLPSASAARSGRGRCAGACVTCMRTTTRGRMPAGCTAGSTSRPTPGRRWWRARRDGHLCGGARVGRECGRGASAMGDTSTSYLHLGAPCRSSRGERVAMGARVGEVGTTGRRSVSEPHLHFGVRLARVAIDYVDPLSLLPGHGAARAAPVAAQRRRRRRRVRAPVAWRIRGNSAAPRRRTAGRRWWRGAASAGARRHAGRRARGGGTAALRTRAA